MTETSFFLFHVFLGSVRQTKLATRHLLGALKNSPTANRIHRKKNWRVLVGLYYELCLHVLTVVVCIV